MARAVVKFRDFSGETSQTSFYVQEPAADGSDFTEYSGTGIGALTGDLLNMLALVTNGVIAARSFNLLEDTDDSLPSDPDAHRELVLRVYLMDTVTGSRFTVAIPTPDAGNLLQAGSDRVDVSKPAWMALVAWFETYGRSPEGNPVNVLDGMLQGRNR